MANYYGTARSNYFRVKDEKSFTEDMAELSGIEVHKKADSELFCILGDDADGFNWNVISREDLESGDYESIDLPWAVMKHLADGEVAVFIEAGSEKLRYIIGNAVAVNNKGESRVIGLDNIYKLAEELTDRPKDITHASY